MRYIELNPVRAIGMAKHPAQSRWSSYRSNAMGEPNRIITARAEYRALGRTDEERQAA